MRKLVGRRECRLERFERGAVTDLAGFCAANNKQQFVKRSYVKMRQLRQTDDFS
uniref:Uncharacterized protein n=1 Tax=Candidatus Nitrotoga fabula TaxID=2182327 RepID=A0A2X0RB34_9PROT|nr:protein of unknown function [Candidatus Nitrotoga fabula]